MIDIRAKQIGRLFSEGGPGAVTASPSERRRTREALFAETFWQRAARVCGAAGAGWSVLGLRGLAGALGCVLRDKAIGVAGLPDPAVVCAHPEGLCGASGALTAEALMEGYARGLHAAPLAGGLAWWSPRRRMVVRPRDFQSPGGLPMGIAARALHVTLDRDFDAAAAIAGRCHRLPPQLMRLYAELHDMGFAHSFEVRGAGGGLLAGGFGVAVGGVFVTLAMFGEEEAQTALGLSVFNGHLAHLGFGLHDCVEQSGLERFGFEPMARADYFNALLENSGFGMLGRWQLSRSADGRTLRRAA